MKNLVLKELTLSINKFFYILPILLAALMMIPTWIYLIVPMYFFWISVPQIYSAYIAHGDYSFMIMLPVTKKDIVTSKVLSLIILELVHLLFMIVFGIIHNAVYTQFNWFIDIGPHLYGYALLLFGLFNISFLPYYFKTAYFFGKPLILGVVITVIVGLGLELLNILVPSLTNLIDPQVLSHQFYYLIVGTIIFVVLSFISYNKSKLNYENIK